MKEGCLLKTSLEISELGIFAWIQIFEKWCKTWLCFLEKQVWIIFFTYQNYLYNYVLDYHIILVELDDY